MFARRHNVLCVILLAMSVYQSIYIEKNANHSVDNELTLKFSEFVNSGIYVAIQYPACPRSDIFFKVNIVDHSN